MFTGLHRRFALVFALVCLSLSLVRMGRQSYQVDFRAFYVAAETSHFHLDPYLNHRELGEKFTDINDEASLSRFIYPPPALFLFAPFGRLTYTEARSTWTLLSIAVLGGTLLALCYSFGVPDIWIVLAFSSLPVMACIERGQVDILLLCLLTAGFLVRNSFLSGCCLGAAVAVKVFPVVMVLWMLLNRRVRTAAFALGSAGVLVLASAGQFGVKSYPEFVQTLQSNGIPRVSAATQAAMEKAGTISSEGIRLLPPASFMGGPNNPLLLAGRLGAPFGLLLVMAYFVFARLRKLPPDISYFGLLLAAQCMNIYLWTMGMVMYLPYCVLGAARIRNKVVACALFVPLFLPASVQWHGISLRFTLAMLLMLLSAPYMAGKDEKRNGLAGLM